MDWYQVRGGTMYWERGVCVQQLPVYGVVASRNDRGADFLSVVLPPSLRLSWTPQIPHFNINDWKSKMPAVGTNCPFIWDSRRQHDVRDATCDVCVKQSVWCSQFTQLETRGYCYNSVYGFVVIAGWMIPVSRAKTNKRLTKFDYGKIRVNSVQRGNSSHRSE